MGDTPISFILRLSLTRLYRLFFFFLQCNFYSFSNFLTNGLQIKQSHCFNRFHDTFNFLGQSVPTLRNQRAPWQSCKEPVWLQTHSSGSFRVPIKYDIHTILLDKSGSQVSTRASSATTPYLYPARKQKKTEDHGETCTTKSNPTLL